MDRSEGNSEATIYDVARVAGVSPSTVSRAFARPGRVSAHTSELIHRVAEQLGYRGRSARRAMRAKPPVLALGVSDSTNAFDARVVRGCQAAATGAGFVVALNDSRGSLALERELLRRSRPLLDGLVVVSTQLPDDELRAVAQEVPTIVLNRRVSGVPSLVPDLAHGARLVAEHLAGLGHEALAYLAARDNSWVDSMRWRAVGEAARGLGLAVERIGPQPPTVEGGRAAAATVVARRIRAVLCHNDVLAIGLIEGLAAKGVAVPGEVSVVGFDNIFAGAVVRPALTTVAAPLAALGDAAVRHVAAALGKGREAHGDDERRPVTLPVQLVVRESTAAPA